MPASQGAQMPPQVAAVLGIIWLLFMAGMVTSYIVMLIAFWKGMLAHQKIAQALSQIADKLQYLRVNTGIR